MDFLAELVCDEDFLPAVCEDVIFLLMGFDKAQFNETLLDNPQIGMGVNFSDKEMRYFPAKKYNIYNIFYTVEDDHIFIVRILHGKRDIASILEES